MTPTRRRPSRPRKTRAAASPSSSPDPAAATDAFEGPDRILQFAESVSTKSDAPAAPAVQPRLERWVTFGLAGETFALPVTEIREVIRVGSITRVPHAPYPVRGIVNLRGRVVPVVDLRLRIGVPEAALDRQSRILITEFHKRFLGLLVDAVHHVKTFDRNLVVDPPADVMTVDSEYIVGVHQGDGAGELFVLLDVAKVLTIPDSLQSSSGQRPATTPS